VTGLHRAVLLLHGARVVRRREGRPQQLQHRQGWLRAPLQHADQHDEEGVGGERAPRRIVDEARTAPQLQQRKAEREIGRTGWREEREATREARRQGGRREGGREGMEGREGREGGRKARREGGTEGGKEGRREGGSEVATEGWMDGGRERGRERDREGESECVQSCESVSE
jgi:hypothetical protein